jgi:hypothetical protein
VLELAQSDEFQEMMDTDNVSMSDLIDMVAESDLDTEAGHVFGWAPYLFVTANDPAPLEPVASNDPAPLTPITAADRSSETEELLNALVERIRGEE